MPYVLRRINNQGQYRVFLNHSAPCFLRHGLLLNLELIDLAQLLSSKPQGCPPVSVSPDTYFCTQPLHRCWVLNPRFAWQ